MLCASCSPCQRCTHQQRRRFRQRSPCQPSQTPQTPRPLRPPPSAAPEMPPAAGRSLPASGLRCWTMTMTVTVTMTRRQRWRPAGTSDSSDLPVASWCKWQRRRRQSLSDRQRRQRQINRAVRARTTCYLRAALSRRAGPSYPARCRTFVASSIGDRRGGPGQQPHLSSLAWYCRPFNRQLCCH